MKKRIISLVLIFMLLWSVILPAIPRAQAQTVFKDVCEYVTTTANLNARTGPGTSYRRVTTIPKGQQVLRIGISTNNWSKVIVKNKVLYMHSAYLQSAKYVATKDVAITKVKLSTNYTRVNELVYTNTNLNVRSGPGTSYSKVGMLTRADVVTRVGKGSDGWDQIIYKNEVRYASSNYLFTVKDMTPPSVQYPVYYATTNLNVRAEPSASSRLLGMLKANEGIESLDEVDGWHKIKFGGQTAYVSGEYLSETQKGQVDTKSFPLTYHDDTCAITIYKEWYKNAYVYAAHITFVDYDRLWTECANGAYRNGTETTSHAAQRVGALFAVNGCYSSPNLDYTVVRKGKIWNGSGRASFWCPAVYSSENGKLVSAWDGSWSTPGVSGGQIDDLVAKGLVTDTFCFGPPSMFNGEIANSSDTSRAQRTFLGTNGNAGDIWICVSDGRYNDGKSAGLRFVEAAEYLKEKGCTFCVHLDGGGSSTMYFNGAVLNAAKSGQRSVVDFVIFK